MAYVVKFSYLLLFIFSFFSLFADVTIESSINQNQGHIGFPIPGTITITADKGSIIDANSFEIEGQPLETSLVKNVYLSGNTVVTIYNFSLPPQELGLHVLSPISVKVNGHIYRSLQTSYSVTDSASFFPAKIPAEKSFIKLEAFVKGPTQLYVGERTTLVYRISYNRSIDLTKSELPFIHTDAFLKVGDSQVRDEQQDNLTIQEISQEVEATTVGTYLIGPSFVEGYAYQLSLIGKKEYEPQLLHAEAPAIEIKVTLFSNENQPASFNGGIGKIDATVSLLTPSQIEVGQTIELTLAISGINNLSEFRFPALMCQPGFSGLFSLDELDIRIQNDNQIKKFYFGLRVLNALVFEIPSIEVSSFDPLSKRYQVVRTPSIPINLINTPNQTLVEPIFPIQIEPDENVFKKLFSQKMISLPLNNFKLSLQMLQLPFYQRLNILNIIPLVFLFLFYFYQWQAKYLSYLKKEESLSQVYLKAAAKKSHQQVEFLNLLEKSLVWKLVEMKIYTQAEVNLSVLKSNEKLIPFYKILLHIQNLQYGNEKNLEVNHLLNHARALIHSKWLHF